MFELPRMDGWTHGDRYRDKPISARLIEIYLHQEKAVHMLPVGDFFQSLTISVAQN